MSDPKQRLQDKLGLENCLVVRSHGDDDDVRRQIGAAAARALSDTLHEDEVLGVTWGRTLTATASQFAHLPRLSIVQLTGVVAPDLGIPPPPGEPEGTPLDFEDDSALAERCPKLWERFRA